MTTIIGSVIASRTLDQDLVCSLNDNGTNIDAIRRMEMHASQYGYEIPTNEQFDTVAEVIEYWDKRMTQVCQFIDSTDMPEMDCWDCDYEDTVYGVKDEVSYIVTWLGGAMLINIVESPVTGTFEWCSPCVPNTADLDSPCEDGVLAYDVPSDWRVQD